VLVLLMYSDREVLLRSTRFQMYCQPEVKKKCQPILLSTAVLLDDVLLCFANEFFFVFKKYTHSKFESVRVSDIQ